MMNKKKFNTILPAILITILLVSTASIEAETAFPEYIAYNIKAERIPLSPDSIKITWQMNQNFSGEFVVGRSEVPFNSIKDILKSKLVGVFNPAIEGILIDRDLQQGKEYYYVVLSKEKLLKREINILKDVNVTSCPVSLYPEPGMVESIKSETINQVISEPVKISSALNKIVKLYFYKGRYELASKELNKFIKNTDNNYQRSLAKLFLGKTCIELKEYEKAILTLSSIDVTEAFPEESKFWSEFALLRLK